MTVPQAAEVLGISAVSLYKLIQNDKSFPVISKGKVILIFDIYSFMIGKYWIIVPIITGMYNKLQIKYNGIVFFMYSFI